MSERERSWLWGGPWLGAAFSMALLLGAAFRRGGLGFPLDDAWIFQTYARNLAQGLGWVYRPGVPSAGATAPLWVLALVPGVWLRWAPLAWTYALGWLALGGLGALAAWAWRRVGPPAWRPWAVGVGVALTLEWHLAWAAASGMETLWFAWGVFAWLVAVSLRWGAPWMWAAGIGVLVWLRPDALALGLPLAVAWWTLPRVERTRAAGQMAGGLALTLGPYVGWHYAVAGTPWPNTFYAKQAEYAALLTRPLAERVVRVVVPLLAGVGVLAVPGLLLGGWEAWRRKAWRWFLGPLWLVAHWGAYALRLPVSYQHGRYAMPLLPVALGWALWGIAWRVEAVTSERIRRLLAWGVGALVGMLTAVFLALGARVYAADVQVIATQMVAPAQWLAYHAPADALVAAHDIGALGYFAPQPLLDLAGLINPEVIPLLGDEAALAEWVLQRGAVYVMAFAGQYPTLERRCRVVYRALRVAALGRYPTMWIWACRPP